mgnify:CR=1 FL=1
MYFVRYRPQAAIPALRCGISRSLFCQKKGHGVPAAWLGTKGTYPICLMLRRRSIAPLSLSRCFLCRAKWKRENTLQIWLILCKS